MDEETSTRLRICNQVLEFASRLNIGGDHNVTLELVPLPAAESLSYALAVHFEAMVDPRNGATYPAAWWHIGLRPLAGSLADALTPVVHTWLFAHPWAVALLGAGELARTNAVYQIVHLIGRVVGEGADAHEVVLAPPMWYATYWQDVGLSSPSGRYLLSARLDD